MLEDFFFAEVKFEPDGNRHFPEFPAECLLRIQKRHLHQLLSDRAGSLTKTAALQIGPDCSEYPQQIYPPVLKKTGVFCCKNAEL